PMKRAFLPPALLAATAIATALLALSNAGAESQTLATEAPEYGPAKGVLVIVGGGDTRGTGIMEAFIERAGGRASKFVIVPTAGGNRDRRGNPRVYNEEQVVARWKQRYGLENVRMLHTHDPKVADMEEFGQPLREANAVWFDGGRQWNIVDSYANTLAYKE